MGKFSPHSSQLNRMPLIGHCRPGAGSLFNRILSYRTLPKPSFNCLSSRASPRSMCVADSSKFDAARSAASAVPGAGGAVAQAPASATNAASAASRSPASARDPLDPQADVHSISIAAASPGYRITVALIFFLRLEIERWRLGTGRQAPLLRLPDDSSRTV